MEQSEDSYSTPRVPYDETGDNGYILGNKYSPEELLAEFLCYVDNSTLLNCQLVYQRWKSLIRNYVWHKKPVMTLTPPDTLDEYMPWKFCYWMVKQKF